MKSPHNSSLNLVKALIYMHREARNLFNAFILSLFCYGIEVYSNTSWNIIKKLNSLYKQMVKTLNGAFKSQPSLFQHLQIKWHTFKELVLYKRASYFSRIIRIPSHNLLSQLVHKEYWKWKRWRNRISLLTILL